MTSPPPIPGTVAPLPDQLKDRDADRLTRYRDYLEYYDGTAGGPPHTRPRGRTNDRDRVINLNYGRAIVDKGASYLITHHTPTVQLGSRSRGRALATALEEVWEANDLQQLDLETEVDTATLGDGAFKVSWSEAEQRVVVTAPDVQRIHAWSSPANVRILTRVCLVEEYSAYEFEDVYGVAAPPRTDPTKKEPTYESWTPTDYELWHGKHRVLHEPNPYGVIPIVLYPNVPRPKTPWGISDLDGIREPLSELNRAVTQLSRILELSGNPITVLETVEETADIAVQPGAVWRLPDGGKAYLLDLLRSGGMNLHLQYIAQVLTFVHDMAEIPRIAFGDAERTASGVALQTAMDPLIRRVARKRLIRTRAFRQRDALILKLLEHHTRLTVPAGTTTGIDWAPIFSNDPSQLVWGNQPPAPAPPPLVPPPNQAPAEPAPIPPEAVR